MKRFLLLISFYLIFTAGFTQPSDRNARRLFSEGCDNISRNKYSEAIRNFSDALKISPGFLEAYENRGVAKYYLMDYKGATEDYDKALEINPDDFNTYGRRGWAKYRLQDYDGAIADFTQAIRGADDKAQYYSIRGQVKYQLGDFEEAIAGLASNRLISSFRLIAGKRDVMHLFFGYWLYLAMIYSTFSI